MDITDSATPIVSQEENQHSTSVNIETTCWGCGLYVLVSSHASVFKCGWCGAITNLNTVRSDKHYFRWSRLRDRCFLCIVLLFMLFFICGGTWAVYPVIFSLGYFSGGFNLLIIVLLSVSTLSSFSLSAFLPAGTPPTIIWGSYPTVRKGGLENYTFCHHCSKPKSPRAHHCRSCGMCILDMDHHCPFIGNCVGAANHRSFILFLISTLTSTIYVAILTAYAASYNWPAFNSGPVKIWNGLFNIELVFGVLRDYMFAFFRSAVFLSARGVVLVYLCIASISVTIGLIVLLWQQLCYIYMGQTYLHHLSADSEEKAERDCQNLVKFFYFPSSASAYLPTYWKSRKRHVK